MIPSSPASAADSPTGAPAGSNFERYLQAQDLKVEDIEANRAGKVSPRQVEIAAKHRGRTTSYLLFGFGVAFVGALVVAFIFYRAYHRPVYFVVPALAVVMGVIAYVIYAALWKFPSLEGKKVELVEGRADFVRHLGTRDEYHVKINDVTYTGFGRIGHEYEGLRLKMYVFPEKKIVVGIEPPDDAKQ